MKSQMKKHFLLLIAVVFAAGTSLMAQKSGNGNITGKTFEVASFTGIDIGGAIKVQFTQADESRVYFETDENLMDQVKIEVKDGILHIAVSNIKNAAKLSATVTSPMLHSLDASGASSFETGNDIQTDHFRLDASGAAKVSLSITTDLLESNLSGASKASISGYAVTHNSELSGASKLSSKTLETETTDISASGASDAWISAKQLKQSLSGAAKVNYEKEPLTVDGNEETIVIKAYESDNGDTVNVNVGGVRVQVIDGDSTVVVVGSRRIVVDEKGSVNITREKTHKFNGHWAGVELGVNGLLTSDFNMSYSNGLEFLDQRMEKSINVNLNFYEQNIPLNKSGTVGLVSGLGLSWNNYRFANNVMLVNENNEFNGYYMEGVNVKKSKLVNTYLTLPLFLEFQTNSTRKKESAHIAVGVVGGWRFSTHTKIYFLEANKEYQLRDPLTGILQPEIMRSPSSTSRNIVKDFNSFQQSPFKLDASVRVGWGIVNLYATYAITPMFVKNRGPELYPFSVGITLNAW